MTDRPIQTPASNSEARKRGTTCACDGTVAASPDEVVVHGREECTFTEELEPLLCAPPDVLAQSIRELEPVEVERDHWQRVAEARGVEMSQLDKHVADLLAAGLRVAAERDKAEAALARVGLVADDIDASTTKFMADYEAQAEGISRRMSGEAAAMHVAALSQVSSSLRAALRGDA